MNKWIFASWTIFFLFLGSVLYLGNKVPENSDDSIVKQYKIVVNDDAIVAAKDERTKVEKNVSTPIVTNVAEADPITVDKVEGNSEGKK